MYALPWWPTSWGPWTEFLGSFSRVVLRPRLSAIMAEHRECRVFVNGTGAFGRFAAVFIGAKSPEFGALWLKHPST